MDDQRTYEEIIRERALDDLAPMDGSEPRADVRELWLRELHRMDETCEKYGSACDLAIDLREIILGSLSETEEMVEIMHLERGSDPESDIDYERWIYAYWILEDPRVEMFTRNPDTNGTYEITISGSITRTPWSYDSDGLALVSRLRLHQSPESLTTDQERGLIRIALEEHIWMFTDLEMLHREDEIDV